jgi:nicotinate (nicotinamide) nucleotide adenylyltransferase
MKNAEKPVSMRSTPVKKTVVCYGASFDPPHFAHAAIVFLAAQTLPEAEIWLLPSLTRWDKAPVASLDERFEWCGLFAAELAKTGIPVAVSKEEFDFSKTFRGTTVFFQHLCEKYPDVSFVFLCGEDSFRSLPQWRDPTTGSINGLLLLNSCDVWVVPRTVEATNAPTNLKASAANPAFFGHPRVRFLPRLETLDAYFHTKHGLAGGVAALSSTALREYIQTGCVPDGTTFRIVLEAVLAAGVYARQEK